METILKKKICVFFLNMWKLFWRIWICCPNRPSFSCLLLPTSVFTNPGPHLFLKLVLLVLIHPCRHYRPGPPGPHPEPLLMLLVRLISTPPNAPFSECLGQTVSPYPLFSVSFSSQWTQWWVISGWIFLYHSHFCRWMCRRTTTITTTTTTITTITTTTTTTTSMWTTSCLLVVLWTLLGIFFRCN